VKTLSSKLDAVLALPRYSLNPRPMTESKDGDWVAFRDIVEILVPSVPLPDEIIKAGSGDIINTKQCLKGE